MLEVDCAKRKADGGWFDESHLAFAFTSIKARGLVIFGTHLMILVTHLQWNGAASGPSVTIPGMHP
ncbi:uncharacterized protein BDZ99DRAFT_463669 [Mytilinidion resinicola]|uniref:Uncharacterized protein n=1 Tax=Mytilinidion resinicola TaxID=574789 RepID=A0A6A6YJQ2_9PEZI|nr:uncharacterized protein BDZ99DRAFT_463669 [Mytilinidion resinicola]KAF2808788.1 hypothetical protein BDZ99DRAFT_463669 [Mytilinidion resinicola]